MEHVRAAAFVPAAAFAFDEADHLMRIHLKLGLEDLGFVVVEENSTLALFGEPVRRNG
ncbi:hypothetical protein [Sphingomonas sp.]|jgi:hypothetical protein|uniref:hypothetical protein n=1 Tax=Sphingomonas sp. TaxID=28214 RepID=UPI002ED9AC8F